MSEPKYIQEVFEFVKGSGFEGIMSTTDEQEAAFQRSQSIGDILVSLADPEVDGLRKNGYALVSNLRRLINNIYLPASDLAANMTDVDAYGTIVIDYETGEEIMTVSSALGSIIDSAIEYQGHIPSDNLRNMSKIAKALAMIVDPEHVAVDDEVIASDSDSDEDFVIDKSDNDDQEDDVELEDGEQEDDVELEDGEQEDDVELDDNEKDDGSEMSKQSNGTAAIQKAAGEIGAKMVFEPILNQYQELIGELPEALRRDVFLMMTKSDYERISEEEYFQRKLAGIYIIVVALFQESKANSAGPVKQVRDMCEQLLSKLSNAVRPPDRNSHNSKSFADQRAIVSLRDALSCADKDTSSEPECTREKISEVCEGLYSLVERTPVRVATNPEFSQGLINLVSNILLLACVKQKFAKLQGRSSDKFDVAMIVEKLQKKKAGFTIPFDSQAVPTKAKNRGVSSKTSKAKASPQPKAKAKASPKPKAKAKASPKAKAKASPKAKAKAKASPKAKAKTETTTKGYKRLTKEGQKWAETYSKYMKDSHDSDQENKRSVQLMEAKINNIGSDHKKKGKGDVKYRERVQMCRNKIQESMNNGDDLLTMFYNGNDDVSQEILGKGATGAPSTENIIEAMSVLGPQVVPILTSDDKGSTQNATEIFVPYDFDDVLFERSFSTWPSEVSVALLSLAYMEQEADIIEDNQADLDMEDDEMQDNTQGDDEYEDLEGLRAKILSRRA